MAECWWSKDTVAVVSGANKGIGFEFVRLFAEKGLTVVLTSRDVSRGQAALEKLKAQGLTSVVFHQLDVSSVESVNKLASWLKSQYGGFDILINNAAVAGYTFEYESAKTMVETNYYGVKNVVKILLPLLRASSNGARIVNVTTRLALYNRLNSDSLKQKLQDEEKHTEELADALATKYLEDMKAGRADEEGWVSSFAKPSKHPMYSESKIFLNIYAQGLAKSLAETQPEGHDIFVASFYPGITDTDMFNAFVTGGSSALPPGFTVKTAAEGAETGIWLALLLRNEWPTKNGKFFAERAEYSFGQENPPL